MRASPSSGHGRTAPTMPANGRTTRNGARAAARVAFKRPWTYGADNAGKWKDNAKWGGGSGAFPNSSEMTASFTNTAAGTSRTVTVDGSIAPINPRAAAIEFSSALSYTIAGSN